MRTHLVCVCSNLIRSITRELGNPVNRYYSIINKYLFMYWLRFLVLCYDMRVRLFCTYFKSLWFCLLLLLSSLLLIFFFVVVVFDFVVFYFL